MVFSGSARRAEGRRPEARRVLRGDDPILDHLPSVCPTELFPMFLCSMNVNVQKATR